MATLPVHKVVANPAPVPAPLRRISPTALAPMLVRFAPQPPQSLPLANTQTGNLFLDRTKKNLHWYLPEFSLAEPDTRFEFAAEQTGVDSTGNPYNTAQLRLTLQKNVPSDVAAFKAANPAADVREISLHDFGGFLITNFKDGTTGQTRQNNYVAAITTTAVGNLEMSFTLLGSAVIILYENLKQGGAELQLVCKYDVWQQVASGLSSPSIAQPFAPHPVPLHPLPPHPVSAHPAAPTHLPIRVSGRTPILAPVHVSAARVVTIPRGTTAVHPGGVPQPAPIFQHEIRTASFHLELGTAYNAGEYSTSFTIKSNSSTRPIVDVNDLKNFNMRQSEFRELKSLGDIGAKFPSFSRAYLGAVSKTIVLIPARYAIVSSSQGIGAQCSAVLDSAASGGARCKFEFAFTVAPDISSVELLQLSQEIGNNADLKGYTIKMPESLKEQTVPKLLTAFQSSAQYARSSDPHQFALMLEIKDQQDQSPAVASANIVLKQLCASGKPSLIATLSLKLDDDYPDPVETIAALNLHLLAESDDVSLVSGDAGTATFQNRSRIDLEITNCAFLAGSSIEVIPLNKLLKPGETLSVPVPDEVKKPQIFVDREVAAQGDIAKSDIAQYLTFQSQDVQTTQFAFGVNASGIDFDGLGIDRIGVQVTIPSVPDLAVPAFSLVKLRSVDGTVAAVPLQNAVTSLNGTALFTVHYQDANKSDSTFTLQHDFIDSPVLILQKPDLPTN